MSLRLCTERIAAYLWAFQMQFTILAQAHPRMIQHLSSNQITVLNFAMGV